MLVNERFKPVVPNLKPSIIFLLPSPLFDCQLFLNGNGHRKTMIQLIGVYINPIQNGCRSKLGDLANSSDGKRKQLVQKMVSVFA